MFSPMSALVPPKASWLPQCKDMHVRLIGLICRGVEINSFWDASRWGRGRFCIDALTDHNRLLSSRDWKSRAMRGSSQVQNSILVATSHWTVGELRKQNMADAAKNHWEPVIKNAPSILKVDIQAHFGFYEITGKHKLDKTHAVCKICHTKIKYVGNTTNLRNHVSRFHSEKLTPSTIKETVDPAQPRIDEKLSISPPNAGKAKRITQSVVAFIAADLRPYSVVENPVFATCWRRCWRVVV